MISNNESVPLIAPQIGVGDLDKTNTGSSCCTSTVFNSDVFFNPKTGWMQYFDPVLNMKQLLNRNREGAFYAFDAFRALAFLWVSCAHFLEGLEIAFTGVSDWSRSKTSYLCFGTNSIQGITVFFTISGFLNFFVALRIAHSLNVKGMSFRVIRNFLFRRYMHLAPNLYFIIPVAMIIGYYNTNTSNITEFYTSCLGTWWLNIIFIGNFSGYFNGVCINSLWTISTEMQFYILSVPILFVYCWNKIFGFAVVVSLVIGVLLFRSLVVAYYSDGYMDLAYDTPMGRGDAYCLGILLYMFYENIVKPIKTRSYYNATNNNSISNSGSITTTDSNQNHHLTHDGSSSSSSSTNSATKIEGATVVETSSTNNTPVKDNDDIYFQFQAFIQDNIIQPTHTYYREKSTQLHFLHTHAPLYMIISIYIAWFLAIFFIVFGLLFVFTNFSYCSVTSSGCATYASQSYGFFVVAGATVSLLFFSIEGSSVPFIPWLFNQYFWYPLGNLTYTGYLLSIICNLNFGSVILKYNNNVQLSWTDLNYGLGVYFGMYVGVILLNLALAVIFSLLVERPFMNLGKAIIFNNLWEDEGKQG